MIRDLDFVNWHQVMLLMPSVEVSFDVLLVAALGPKRSKQIEILPAQPVLDRSVRFILNRTQ